MSQSQPTVPAVLAGLTTVQVFIKPRTRQEFEQAVELLGGPEVFKKPRWYGVWTKDGTTCLYPPTGESTLPAALAALRR